MLSTLTSKFTIIDMVSFIDIIIIVQLFLAFLCVHQQLNEVIVVIAGAISLPLSDDVASQIHEKVIRRVVGYRLNAKHFEDIFGQ